jgi:hypothetical protein
MLPEEATATPNGPAQHTMLPGFVVANVVRVNPSAIPAAVSVGTGPFTAGARPPTNSSGTTAYATAGGKAYGGLSGQFVQFNPDGTVNHVLTGVTTGTDLGMWGNPVTGHIEASSGSGLIDINPLANGGLGSFRVINAGGDGDVVFCFARRKDRI